MVSYMRGVFAPFVLISPVVIPVNRHYLEHLWLYCQQIVLLNQYLLNQPLGAN